MDEWSSCTFKISLSKDKGLPIYLIDEAVNWEYSLRLEEARELAGKLLGAVAAYERGDRKGSWSVTSPAP